MEPIALSIEDTRKALGGIGRTKTYALIGEGKLRTFKVGTRTLVTTESIRAFVTSQTA